MLRPGNAHFKKYFKPLYNLAGVISKKYPGWLMRIYHNVSTDDVKGTELLCKIFCHYPHVDLCNVIHLPDLGECAVCVMVLGPTKHAA